MNFVGRPCRPAPLHNMALGFSRKAARVGVRGRVKGSTSQHCKATLLYKVASQIFEGVLEKSFPHSKHLRQLRKNSSHAARSKHQPHSFPPQLWTTLHREQVHFSQQLRCSPLGSEEGSYLRHIDFCITQL